MRFLGQFNHTLDEKGRLVLPVRFRERLTTAVISTHRDDCLALWTPEEFEIQAEAMDERMNGNGFERSMARVFFASASEAIPDRQGRVIITPALRTEAKISREGHVVVTGAGNHVEIWAAEIWASHQEVGLDRMRDINVN